MIYLTRYPRLSPSTHVVWCGTGGNTMLLVAGLLRLENPSPQAVFSVHVVMQMIYRRVCLYIRRYELTLYLDSCKVTQMLIQEGRVQSHLCSWVPRYVCEYVVTQMARRQVFVFVFTQLCRIRTRRRGQVFGYVVLPLGGCMGMYMGRHVIVYVVRVNRLCCGPCWDQ